MVNIHIIYVSFNEWGSYRNRPGFVYIYESYAKYGNLKLIGDDDGTASGKVRCVRDVID